tara:strand:+ start:251 stop:469 length:219 start_codon:yes stop_codon:yes gene_type:complete
MKHVGIATFWMQLLGINLVTFTQQQHVLLLLNHQLGSKECAVLRFAVEAGETLLLLIGLIKFFGQYLVWEMP